MRIEIRGWRSDLERVVGWFNGLPRVEEVGISDPRTVAGAEEEDCLLSVFIAMPGTQAAIFTVLLHALKQIPLLPEYAAQLPLTREERLWQALQTVGQRLDELDIPLSPRAGWPENPDSIRRGLQKVAVAAYEGLGVAGGR